MRWIYGLLLLCLIAVAILHAFWLIAVGLILVFSVYYNTKWLVLLAFLIDGYFGAFSGLPVLTLSSIIWFLIVEIVRPRLRKVT